MKEEQKSLIDTTLIHMNSTLDSTQYLVIPTQDESQNNMKKYDIPIHVRMNTVVIEYVIETPKSFIEYFPMKEVPV